MNPQKTLYIVRHGKSSWDYFGISDIDRPLKERGIKNAYEIADSLKNKSTTPEIIYSSPAARAVQTAVIFMRVLDFPEERFFIRNNLYLSEPEEIMNIIKPTPDEINSVMIFGHNPGFTDLANYLSNLKLSNIPTSGMVVLQFSSNDWKSIRRDTLISSFEVFPENN